MSTRPQAPSRGPFRADQVGEDDRYELSNGHPIYRAPAGRRHGSSNLTGGLPLATDPLVREAGVDVGFSLEPGTLRAPDLAVGNVPELAGFSPVSPPLAVEYADTGNDEGELQAKIAELLDAGTRLVWVVRLVGPRRVEVYEAEKPMRIASPGQLLEAPDILQNPLPVEALYDREASFEASLRNLLQRRGYGSIDEIQREARAGGRLAGQEEGREEELRQAIVDLCEAYGTPLDAAQRTALQGLGLAALLDRKARIKRERRWV